MYFWVVNYRFVWTVTQCGIRGTQNYKDLIWKLSNSTYSTTEIYFFFTCFFFWTCTSIQFKFFYILYILLGVFIILPNSCTAKYIPTSWNDSHRHGYIYEYITIWIYVSMYVCMDQYLCTVVMLFLSYPYILCHMYAICHKLLLESQKDYQYRSVEEITAGDLSVIITTSLPWDTKSIYLCYKSTMCIRINLI